MLWPLFACLHVQGSACVCVRLAFVPLKQVAAMTFVFPAARVRTHTHKQSHTLSLCHSVLSGVSPTRFYRAWNSLIISGGNSVQHADTSAYTHAKTPTRTHTQTHTQRGLDRVDYTSRAAQPDRGTSTKKETQKEYKRLIWPCCISLFHLPTLAHPHPHRLDPIASARTVSCNTNTPVWRNIAVEFFFIISSLYSHTCT